MTEVVKPAAFAQDAPWDHANNPKPEKKEAEIEGVIIETLVRHKDDRGNLVELLTARDGLSHPIVHVYSVNCEPGSIRAWVYHKKQRDRLTFIHGEFLIVLYDIREDSPTRGQLIQIRAGLENPIRLTLPTYVVHGVQNIGNDMATFVNLPTEVYDLENPDKYRILHPSAEVPFQF
ncbi:MAG: dTDP-4-dehydrorhamnose 3,5-epimerase family protein [Pseudomonadota bacterium]